MCANPSRSGSRTRKRKNNFIAITGYQDEESPGRALQEIAQAGEGDIQLGGRTASLRCGIGTYGLSAHADTGQLVGCLTGLAAKGHREPEVVLVHGDGAAREALQTAIFEAGLQTVHRPDLGESLEPQLQTKASLRPMAPEVSLAGQHRGVNTETGTVQLLAPDLPALAHALVERDGPERYYSVQEMMLLWGDIEGAKSGAAIQRLVRMLRYRQSPFQSHRKAPYLFKVKKTHQSTGTPAGTETVIDGKGLVACDMQTAFEVVDRILPEDCGLYRRGARQGEGVLVLYFDFPDVTEARFGPLFGGIEQETGWLVRVQPTPRQHALAEAAVEMLSPEWTLSKSPSIHVNDKRVVVHLNLPTPPPQTVDVISAAFSEKTGYELVIQGERVPPEKGNSPPVALNPDLIGEAFDETSRTPMEVNQAFAVIGERFGRLPHQPVKIGLKGLAIQVAFISPEVGQRYAPYLAELESQLGRKIVIKPTPNQNLIQEAAREMVSTWGLNKPPSLRKETTTVTVRLLQPPPPDEVAQLAKRFVEATGYRLVLECT